MANVNNMAMYDYDGSMYAFGVVSGYSNVKAVRMYVSTGMGTTYQYFSTEIYDKDTAHINTTQNSTPCFVFNVRTDRDAESGMPTQLDYWLLDENEDGYGRYKFSFSFYSSTSGSSAYLLNSTPLRPTISGSSNIYYQMHNSLTSPTMRSWNDTTKTLRISNIGKYRHIVEIKKKNREDTVNGYSVDVRDYAYTVLMKNFEGGKYWEPIPDTNMIGVDGGESVALCRFFENYSVNALILFDSGASFSTSTKNTCISYATDALKSISAITGIQINKIDTLVSSNYYKANSRNTSLLQNNTWGWNAYINGDVSYDNMYQIFVRFGNASSMSASDFGGQGRWFTTQWAGYAESGTATAHAMIQVPLSISYESLNHVIHEEIYQSLGIGGDNYEYMNSIHADPEYCNPEEYIGIDADIIKFIYNNVWCGWDSFDFINQLDTPCILFADYVSGSSYYDFDLSKLQPGTYEVYVWAAGEKSNPGEIGTSSGKSGTSEFQYWSGGWDDSPYSIKNKYEITVTSAKPALWSWTSSNGTATAEQTQKAYEAITNQGRVTDFSYLVWNDMLSKVKEILDATGNEWDSTYTTYSNARMTYSDKTLSATKFNSLRYNIGCHYSTGITDRSTGEFVYGSYFVTLANCINGWINKIWS